jgi:probable F420-dependent oxidoreductase
VSKMQLGRFGAAVSPSGDGAFVQAAVALEELGFPTIWTGGPTLDLAQIAAAVRATRTARIGTAILAVDQIGADQVAAVYTDLEGSHPGRFVVGLGGAHGPRPLATLTRYLDELDTLGVPADARALAALGPRMVELAAGRTAGALPVLVTPDYIADVRSRLGDDTSLIIEQLVVASADPDTARALARQPLGFLGSLPQYQASFRRMGFSDDDITGLSDHLVDSLVIWGDPATIAGRLTALLDAGADHVALSLSTGSDELRVEPWRELVDELGPLG